MFRFLQPSHVKKLYHRIDKDRDNFGTQFVHFACPWCQHGHRPSQHVTKRIRLATGTGPKHPFPIFSASAAPFVEPLT